MLTTYIVFHDQKSWDYFHEINAGTCFEKMKYILVGNDLMVDDIVIFKSIIAKTFRENIEQYKSLLTFTAWYLLAKNDICKTDYVGIFEYDVKFLDRPLNIELKPDTIFGSIPRNLPDPMYLDAIPGFNRMIQPDELKQANLQPYWNTTSNFIMPKEFLIKFVDWYMKFIPDILQYWNHSHFHERAINVFAANNGYKNETIELIKHSQLCSHGINI